MPSSSNLPPIPPLILASASPRRRRILNGLGLDFTVVVPSVKEIHDAGDPVNTVVENARLKYDEARRLRPDATIIAADTLVFFRGRLIGKPRDPLHAARMLEGFSGRVQVVFTAVALGLPQQNKPDLRVESSTVRFKELDSAVIQAYIARHQPLDRAGAYDIDADGAWLIAGCSGSTSNVMGLPEATVADWLRARGLL